MPHASVKLIPGVNVTATPVLNEAGISQSNLLRFFYDRQSGALSQKLGGYTKFISQATTAIVRALWAWEDTNGVQHLAYGTQNTGAGRSVLGVITNSNVQNITPRATTNASAAVSVASTAGSSYVVITDTAVTGITDYDSVYIAVPISVGGLILFGQYPCDPNGFIAPNSYTIQVLDVLGNPVLATSTSTTGVVPDISTTAGSPIVNVEFPNHGESVGSTFTILTPVTVGGTTFYGEFIVQKVIDADNFTINAPQLPSATASAFINGGNAYYIYSFGVGSIPTGTGYGVLGYGRGGYGSGTAVTPATGSPIQADDWVFDNWGEILLACPENPEAPVPYQPIYQWDPISGSPTATVIPQAPPVNDGFFVAMPQRQIIAWGSTVDGIQDPLLVRWCDIGNFNSWIGLDTNQAGQYRIPRGSRIVGGIQGPQQGLLWTDLAVWSMQYINFPLVYGFNELGSGCGLIARKAAASLAGVVYWMGPSQFFALAGEGVQPVPCPVWDVVFQDLDQSNLQKIRVAVNSRFGEIAWYYPSLAGGGEVDSYVKFNPALNAWDYGLLARSAWVDQSVIGPPVGADPNSLYLYQHETSDDADGQPLLASMETGWFAIGDGENMTYIDQVWPDMKWGYFGGNQNATVNITFYVVDYPGQTPKTFGPYAVTQQTTYISPRFRGRLVAIAVSSNDVGTFWRMGGIRYRFRPDGVF